MTAREIEKMTEDIRIQFAKEKYNGSDIDNMSREDWLSLYVLLLIKERFAEKGE